MGEIIVSCFIGTWLTLAAVLAYKRLKMDYKDIKNTKK